MSDQTDFIALYSELGIEPDCSLDGLRMAYRRRVADLHPDRAGDSGEDELKALNLQYAAALEFHRHYGRLPGAAAPATRRRQVPGGSRRSAQAVANVEEEAEAPQARRPSRMIVYGILLLSALLVWWLSRTDGPSPGSSGGIAGNERGTAPSAAIALRLGMPVPDVVAMLGEPVSRELGGTQWVYGPSWVRFECSQVIDWYSSPLQPLRASRSRPDGEEAAVLARADARRCPPVAAASGRTW
ncbi:J domain-containing protein [Luteimonas viscosa]|uniref:J domain-containing protein n=1 Tax=Luteimonas viscosa TaxID=1132694 RepID=A0A5D4XG63_9GAMM|nr:J domain-containing protein [Luteimonas viscosa]TYT23597.1 J domain-containing protein [Luteimonas viscosa]